MKQFYFTVDIKEEVYISKIQLIQKDKDVNLFNILVTDNNKPFSLLGQNVKIIFEMSDKSSIIQQAIISARSEYEIILSLSDQILSIPGFVLFHLELSKTDNEKVISPKLCFEVTPNSTKDYLSMPSNNSSLLDQAVSIVTEYDNRLEQVESKAAEIYDNTKASDEALKLTDVLAQEINQIKKQISRPAIASSIYLGDTPPAYPNEGMIWIKKPPLRTKVFNGEKQYMLTVDDTINCFKLLTDNKNTYTSIFDVPQLRVLKDLHDAYGLKVLMSCFYELSPSWNLSLATTKWRSEFAANSSWLKFSFHSYNWNTRYTDTSLPQPKGFDLTRNAFYDYELTLKALLPVVGSESWSYEINCFHYNDGRKEEIKKLHDKYGLRILHGIVEQIKDRKYNYFYTTEQVQKIFREDGYYDGEIDVAILHRDASIERIIGNLTGTPGQETILHYLDNYSANHNTLLNFETHEEYLTNALEKQGYKDMCAWCYARGYIPKFQNANEVYQYYGIKETGEIKVYTNNAFLNIL